MKRRSWILGGTLATGAACAGLWRAFGREALLGSDAQLPQISGPLALPRGFAARIISQSGELLEDGSRSADQPDAMACFAGEKGEWILMRNHELDRNASLGAYPKGQPAQAYSPSAHGGVSRLVLSPKTLETLSSNMVLTGTMRNCAGGPSPWGWLSCEETEEAGHGYVFLCSENARQLNVARKVPGYGRFRHEAVAIDPSSLRAYLTEDQSDGRLYRFTPDTPERPFEGTLEALAFSDPKLRSTAHFTDSRLSHAVRWVRVEDPSAQALATRHQAEKEGAAIFVRGEGIWLDGDGVVFTATAGGRRGLGQIFRLSFNDRLRLVAHSDDSEQFAGPDNITVAPWGDLVIAEDHFGQCHIRGITREGKSYPIARNTLSLSEITGVCFSPDGKILFCNLQNDGLTVAINGPWHSLRAAQPQSQKAT